MSKIMIISCGGASFSRDIGEKLQGTRLATEEEIGSHIRRNIAAWVESYGITLGFDYLGGDLWGANQTYRDWNEIGSSIAAHYSAYDGFVILHGQDTIYPAAAHLTFSLQNLGKPVIFADGTIQSYPTSPHDSNQAVLTSILLAAEKQLCEVCVYSSDNILIRGVDAERFSTKKSCSFTSRTRKNLANTGSPTITLNHLNLLPVPTKPFQFIPLNLDLHLGVSCLNSLTKYPMLPVANLDQIDALLLSTPSLSLIPCDDPYMFDTLSTLQARDVPVVLVPQDRNTVINFDELLSQDWQRELWGRLRDLSVIDGHAMTFDTAAAKLRYALTIGLSGQEIKTFMQENIFGETQLIGMKTQRTERYSPPSRPKASIAVSGP